METVTHLGHVCQHGFRSITRKPLKVSQPNLPHILSKNPNCVFSYLNHSVVNNVCVTMETVTHLGQFCQHRFGIITRKPLQVS